MHLFIVCRKLNVNAQCFAFFVCFVGGGGWDAFHPINEPQCISCGCAPSSQELSTTWLCSLMVLSLNKQSDFVVLAELLSYFLAHIVNVWRSQHNQNYNNKSIINQINTTTSPPLSFSSLFLFHVQFAGFSSESLCERIMDAQSNILVTAGR